MAAMICVVIATLNDERTLGRALAALVPAALGGLVREVILADGGSTDATLDIAEDAGARVVAGDGPAQARIAQACAAARSDWLLILDVGHEAPADWMRLAEAHIRAGGERAAWWGQGGVWPFGGGAVSAVLVPRRLYDRMGGYGAGLVRRLGGRAKRLRL